jgi:hypothetical protein
MKKMKKKKQKKTELKEERMAFDPLQCRPNSANSHTLFGIK